MTIAIASGDRQRVVLVADTLAVQGDGHRADAFVSKVLPFAHCAAAAVVRGHGGHKLAIHMAMNTRPALDGIGALPWPAILDRYVGDDQEQFDMLLAGWAPAAGGLAIWRFGEATGYELAEVALPASVALPDFGVALDPVMADGAVIHAAEVLVDLANESARDPGGGRAGRRRRRSDPDRADRRWHRAAQGQAVGEPRGTEGADDMVKMPGQAEIDRFTDFLEQQRRFFDDMKNWQSLDRKALIRLLMADLEASCKAMQLVREFMTKLAELEIRAVRAETALAERADASVPPI